MQLDGIHTQSSNALINKTITTSFSSTAIVAKSLHDLSIKQSNAIEPRFVRPISYQNASLYFSPQMFCSRRRYSALNQWIYTYTMNKLAHLPSNNVNRSDIRVAMREMSSSPDTSHRESPILSPAPAKHSLIGDLAGLSKLRLNSIVVVTTICGFICVGSPIDYVTLASASLGTLLCAVSASSFNQIFEKEYDALMARTKNRCLPTGRISLSTAKLWGVSTGIAGTAMLYFMTNPLTAALGVTNIVLYAGVYTASKRLTTSNTYVGAIVGAIPPVMGWVAAGGSLWSYGALELFSILYFWQLPHFFAQAYSYRKDYANAGFQMLGNPIHDPTGRWVAFIILLFAFLQALIPLATTLIGHTSNMFLIGTSVVNLYILNLAVQFFRSRSKATAQMLFFRSIAQIVFLMTGYIVFSNDLKSEQIHWDGDKVGISPLYRKGLIVMWLPSHRSNRTSNICEESLLIGASMRR